MSLSKFESMLKTNAVYFFDAIEFEEIIQHYIDVGKHALAKKATALALEQHPGSIQLKLMALELLIFENKLEEAKVLLQEIEQIEPHNDEVFIQKAMLLSKESKHHQAIEVLNKALDFVEDPADIWSMLGMEFMYLDDYKNAKHNFIKCVEEDYEDYASLYNVMYCFDMLKSNEEAISFLDAYINKNPYCEIAWHQLGRQYFMLEQYEKALSAFEYAVLVDESFIGGYLEKAKTLEALERFEEAIENYIITLELDDPTAYAYTRIGSCYEELNDLTTALNYYKKAVYEDPSLDRGWMLLANVCYEQKNYQKALYYVNKAIEIDEIKPSYWRKYGDINVKLGFYEEAIKALQTCINLGDNALEIYMAISDIQLFLGSFENVLETLLNADELYINTAEISYRLCGVFMILNERVSALKYLKKGLEIDFESHTILKELFPSIFEAEEIQDILYVLEIKKNKKEK